MPVGHELQKVAPDDEDHVPATQLTHELVDDALATVENEPALHELHDGAPAKDHVPALHDKHCDDDVAADDKDHFPATHNVQDDEEPIDHVPARQDAQEADP